jgi:predicted transposase/invertase (TIGR01784 family)
LRIGIRAINDFAFKKVFGTPENRPVLIRLLNGILKLPLSIVAVVLENPLNPKDFEEDKLTIVLALLALSQARCVAVEVRLRRRKTGGATFSLSRQSPNRHR